PQTEDFQGPIDQNVANSEKSLYMTKIGSKNLGINLGAGVNLNKRHQQIHFEMNGGYRSYKNFEIGGILFGRVVKDNLIGLLVTGKGFQTIRKPPNSRIDFAYGGGAGWTLRSVDTSFNEGRLTIRVQGEFL